MKSCGERLKSFFGWWRQPSGTAPTGQSFSVTSETTSSIGTSVLRALVRATLLPRWLKPRNGASNTPKGKENGATDGHYLETAMCLVLKAAKVLEVSSRQVFVYAFQNESMTEAAPKAEYYHKEWLTYDKLHRTVRRFCQQVIKENKKKHQKKRWKRGSWKG